MSNIAQKCIESKINIMTLNGNNPAIIQVGDNTYADLGATITRHRPGQAKDTNLGYKTFLNGILVSNIVIVEPTAAPSIVPTDEASTTAATTRP